MTRKVLSRRASARTDSRVDDLMRVVPQVAVETAAQLDGAQRLGRHAQLKSTDKENETVRSGGNSIRKVKVA